MKLIIGLFIMVLLGCKAEEKQFLQPNEISLSPPMVTATSTIIDSFVIVNADLKFEGAKIVFTANGEEPSEQSEAYTKPLELTQAGTYKFKAFHPDWKPSDVVTLEVFAKGVPIDSIINITQPSKQYSGVGNNTLINNQKASLAHKNTEWVGYDTIAKSEIILKEKTFVKSLSVSYLNAIPSWIFPPSKVSVMLDNQILNEVVMQPPTALTAQAMSVIHIPINKDVKSLTIEVSNLQSIPNWHDGAGTKAWLFMDEWILNE